MTPPQELTEEARLRAALAEIITEPSVEAWLQRPNQQFDGSTPLQVIERGETDRLWREIRDGNSG